MHTYMPSDPFHAIARAADNAADACLMSDDDTIIVDMSFFSLDDSDPRMIAAEIASEDLS